MEEKSKIQRQEEREREESKEKKMEEEESKKIREHKKWTTRTWLAGGVNKTTILKYCKYFYSKNGCERGDFCTFAHSDDEIGMTWRPRGHEEDEVRRMVLCKFHRQGGQPAIDSISSNIS